MPDRRRWLALYVLCLGTLMVVLDTSIVNVALPSIRASLGFSATSLAWVVNAYLLTFGGFLLLGGRLGDVYGARRLFLAGIALFTLASLACSLSTTQQLLIAARAVQGIGGAIASAVGLSLVVTLFPEPAARAKAMGIAGFVASGGGALGVLLGGALTGLLDWHWIFIVNVPIGVLVCALAWRFVPEPQGSRPGGRIDVAGAATITLALLLAVDAIIDGNQAGWSSTRTLGLLGGAIALLAVFLWVERRVASPLIPLRLLVRRDLAAANVIGVLWAAAMFAWFFISALYLQGVLGYGPLEVGLAFLPANLLMGALSIGVSGRLVGRFGIRRPLVTGLGLAAAGLLLFGRAPVGGAYVADVLPSMVLLGAGAGIAFNPVLLAATGGVAPSESGLASGVVNTSFQLGGAFGLAVLASLAAARTGALLGAGSPRPEALVGGYQLAFVAGAACALVAAALGAWAFRRVGQPGEADSDLTEAAPIELAAYGATGTAADERAA